MMTLDALRPRLCNQVKESTNDSKFARIQLKSAQKLFKEKFSMGMTVPRVWLAFDS